MPRLIAETPIGYRVEMDDGSIADIERNAAQLSFPELFQDTGTQYSPGEGMLPPQPQSVVQPPPPSPFQVDPTLGVGSLQPPQGMFPENQSMLPTVDQALQTQVPPGARINMPVSTSGRGFPTWDPSQFATLDERQAPIMGAIADQYAAAEAASQAEQAQAQVGYRPEDVARGQSYQDVQTARTETEAGLQGMNEAVTKELMQREQEIELARASIPTMDQGRIWKRTGTPGLIMNAASAFIAGFLNPGGPNPVIDNMLKLMDQDLDAQKVDIDTARYNVLGQERSYERTVSRNAMARERYLEARQMKIDSVLYGIETEKQKVASPITQAKYEAVKAGFLVEAAKNQNALLQQVEQNKKDEWGAKFKVANANAQLGLGYESLGAKSAGESPEGPAYLVHPRTREKLYLDPQAAAGLTKENRTKLQENIAADYQVADGLKELKREIIAYDRVYGGIGRKTGIAPGEAAEAWARVEKTRARILEKIVRQFGAALSKHELEIKTAQIPTLPTWTSGLDAQVVGSILDSTLQDVGQRQKDQAGYLGLSKQFVNPILQYDDKNNPLGYSADVRNVPYGFEEQFIPEDVEKITREKDIEITKKVEGSVKALQSAKSGAAKAEAQSEVRDTVRAAIKHYSDLGAKADPEARARAAAAIEALGSKRIEIVGVDPETFPILTNPESLGIEPEYFPPSLEEVEETFDIRSRL